MPELSIDNEICTRCGLCASACPWRLIELKDDGLPRYVDGGAKRCILCGHCEAICQTGALLLDDSGLTPSEFSLQSAMMEPARLGAYLCMRRSIRWYEDKAVDRDTLEQVMDIARYAPSGRNGQDVQWLVIHDAMEVRRLTALAVNWMREISCSGHPLAARYNLAGMVRAWEEGRDHICHNAPHLMVAHVSEENPVARTNAIIALAHLDIVAPSFGLGTCWGGIFMQALNSWEPLQEALDLPPGQMPVHCLMLGYPAVRYQRPPKRKPASIVWR